MPTLDDIIQRVAVEGQEDVVGAFKEIGEAGEKALSGLASLAEGPLGEVAEALGGFVGILTAVTAGVGAFAVKSAEATVELAHLATQMGTTIEDSSTLVTALSRGGSGIEGITLASKRLANAISTDWPTIEQEISQSANTMAAAQLRVAEASNNQAKAQANLSQVSADAARQARSDAQSIVDADLSLAVAQDALAVSQGRAHDKRLDALTLENNVVRAQLAADNARLKSANDQAEATQKQKDAVLALKKANEDATVSAQAFKEAQLKDLPTIIKGVQDIASGAKKSADGFDIAKVSVDNLAKAIIATSGAKTGIDGFVKPTDVQVLRQIADVFHNIDDASVKTALSIKLFGRGVGQDLISTLSEGSAATEKFQKHLEDVGLVITHEEEHIAEGLHKSMNTLESDLGIVADKFGLAFAPTIKSNIDAIIASIEKLTKDGSIQKFGESAAHIFADTQKGVGTIIGAFQSAAQWIRETFGDKTLTFIQDFIKIFALVGAVVVLAIAPLIGWPVVILAVITAIGELSSHWEEFKNLMAGVWRDIAASYQGSFLKVVVDGLSSIIDKVKEAIQWFAKLFQSSSQNSGDGNNLDGFAKGGLVRGKKGIDTNLAWVTDGEFVITPNGSNLGDALAHFIGAGLQGFASGGLVGHGATARQSSVAKPQAGRPFTLQLGSQIFKGLTAPENVVHSLRRLSTADQVSTAGRKPSWVR